VAVWALAQALESDRERDQVSVLDLVAGSAAVPTALEMESRRPPF
jgi:hypothetical protein